MTTALPASEISPGTMVGDYKVVGVLGRGGMGVVYQGVHPKIGKRVAIKVLGGIIQSEEATARFTREAQVVNRIAHDGIVDIINMGQLPGGRHYLVMEYLTGEPLSKRLQRGPFTWPELCDIFTQILAALQAAHDASVVHRDLKPDNIFLASGGPSVKVKILDFGLAKDLGGGQDMTQTGIALGTPRYMAPEQSRGGRYVDFRADLYAVGLMLYEALAGRFPFEAHTPILMLTMHLTEPPPPLSQFARVPPALEQVVLRALEKSPDRRFESATAMAQALLSVAPRDAAVELRRLHGRIVEPAAPRFAPVFAEENTRLVADQRSGFSAEQPTVTQGDFTDEATRLSPPAAGATLPVLPTPRPPQPLRRWVLPLCIGLAVLLGVLGGALVSRQVQPTAPQPTAAPPEQPRKPQPALQPKGPPTPAPQPPSKDVEDPPQAGRGRRDKDRDKDKRGRRPRHNEEAPQAQPDPRPALVVPVI